MSGYWKDQLRDIKKALYGSKNNKERGKGSSKTDSNSPPLRPPSRHPSPKKKVSIRPPVPKPVAQAAIIAAPTAKQSLPTKTSKPPPFKPRLDDKCVLNMPEWSDVGRSLQHPEHMGRRLPPMTVRVGVDFGTAFTKVAIRAGTDLVPADWSAVTGDTSEAGRYVIPGLVVHTPDGEFCWKSLAKADIRGNLKIPVIENAEASECPVATVAHLALVIRYARAFLYRNTEVGRKLAERSLRWELNIGCPTKPHENPEVIAALKRISQVAWLLAAEEQLTEQSIRDTWSFADRESGLEADPGVMPEFVAQIAGYLKSSQVKEGLHALIDVGAATLDVATFNVVFPNDQESTPRIPIFFSAVSNLGTHYLRHNRHSNLGLELSWNDAAPVESPDEFSQQNGKPLEDVEEADRAFVERVVHSIVNIIDGTRTNDRGDPNSTAWREGLPIFVTGGGANCNLYSQAITKVEQEMEKKVRSSTPLWQTPSACFELLKLNPTSGSARKIEAGNRLTVALGLTEDAENIARIVPHREIEKITYHTAERSDHTDFYGD